MGGLPAQPLRGHAVKPVSCLLLSLGLPLMAWGEKGHRLAAVGALHTLPPNLRVWYLDHESKFTQAALEPDLWKERDPDETGRHRIFCEAYGGAAGMPLQAMAARNLVGAWVFEASGQLPWVIAERYRLLVKAFQVGDPEGVVEASGWLCHYVADAQVPLHTTRNRNGKLTAQKGVHKRWETELLEQEGVNELKDLRVAAAPQDPPKTIATWICESHALVAPLLMADRAAGLDATSRKSTHAALFWEAQKGPILQQLRRSAEYTGDLLVAAWIEAGKPARP